MAVAPGHACYVPMRHCNSIGSPFAGQKGFEFEEARNGAPLKRFLLMSHTCNA